MEIEKPKLNEKSHEIDNMKKEDPSNYETSSYCPDLSDMCDENYEFWDFLKHKVDVKRKLNEKWEQSVDVKRKLHEKREQSTIQMNGFWDFIGSSSSIEAQNVSHMKLSLEKKDIHRMCSPNDSGFEETKYSQTPSDFDCEIHRQDDFNREARQLSKSKLEESASSDVFWDFLNRNSPLEKKSTIQMNGFWDFIGPSSSIKAQNVSHMKLSLEKKDIHRMCNNDSGFKETKYSQTPSDFHRQDDFNREARQLSKSKLEESASSDAFWDFLNRNSPLEKEASTDSDDDFWDFLESNSPVIEFREVLNSITDSKTITPATDVSIHLPSEESPFGTDLNNCEPGKCSSTPIDACNFKSYFNVFAEIKKPIQDSKEIINSKKLHKVPDKKYQSGNTLRIDSTNSTSIQNSLTQDTNKNVSSSKECVFQVAFENKVPEQKTDLPCRISSVFSMQLSNPTGTEGNEIIISPTVSAINTAKRNVDGMNCSNKVKNNSDNLIQIEFQKQDRNNKRPLVHSPIGCSSFNVSDDFCDTNVLSGTNLHQSNLMNNELSKKQKPQLEVNIPISESETLSQSATSFINSTQLKAVATANTEANNPNSAPVYLILPSNSESFQNPNYSHYFLIVNNPPDSQQSISQNKYQLPLIRNYFPNTVTSTVSQNVPVTVPQSVRNITKDSGLLIPPEHFTSVGRQNDRIRMERVVNSDNSNVIDKPRYQIYFQPNLTPNVPNQLNPSILQYTDNFKAATSSENPSNNETVFPSLSKIDSNLVHINCIPVTSVLCKKPGDSFPSASAVAQPLKLRSSLKTNPIRNIKPIKNISLGKDKNAIQQTSIPLKIENILDKTLFGLEENDTSFLNDDANPSPIISFPRNKIPLLPFASSHKGTQNIPFATISTKKPSLISEHEIISQGNANTIEIQNKNSSHENKSLNQFINTINSNLILTQNRNNTCSLNVSVPITKHVHLNFQNSTDGHNPESINEKQDFVSGNLKSAQSNQYVQVKLAPSQNNSMTTLQELFPPPISMVPVSVMPPTQNVGQSSISKVLVLKGTSGDRPIFTQKGQSNPITTRHRPNPKRVKMKKIGRKTVRELLEERRNILNQQGADKPQKEVRVLRRILKLSGDNSRPEIEHDRTKTFSVSSNRETIDSHKRPNILVLPSASNPMKKNIIKDDLTKNLVRMRQLDFIGHSSSIANESNDSHTCETPGSSKNGKRDFRPRHYDISELQIGHFKVEDDIDYFCGRFRSKFKVIFSKRQFLYDFPVSRCNRMDLKSSQIWEKRARVIVPFKSVISMDLRDRTIHVTVNSAPSIYLGRLQARAGIISNTTVYDTPIEDGCPWGDDIRRTFIHKIILRKRQANKLKAFLWQFDERFVTLTDINVHENGTPDTRDMLIFEGELSPTSLKKSLSKNKKSSIRRLPQWDSPGEEEQKSCNEDVMNQMCSCRISCRSIRCSCVKAAKSCKTSSTCLCINCDNPLNILESLGLNIDFSLSDSCLFQNIYPIPKLLDFLQREMKLTCCNTFARVQDCIPGTVLCPNVDCNVQLEFSWCRGIVCYPERNPRNHCSFCGQCCFSNKRHCPTCNRCYVVSPKLPYCPTCREIAPVCSINEFEFQVQGNHLEAAFYENQKASNKATSKPEIIVLDAWSVSKFDDRNKKENAVESQEEISVQDTHDIVTIESPEKEHKILSEYVITL